MATLNIKVNGKTDTCTLYATKEEAGDTPLSLKVGGNMAYAAMTTDLTDSEITKLRVKKNGTVYAVRKQAKPEYQTLKLTIGQRGNYLGYADGEFYSLYGYGALTPSMVYGEKIVEFGIINSVKPSLSFYMTFGTPENKTIKVTGNKLRFVIPELNIDTGFFNGQGGEKGAGDYADMKTQFAANVGKTVDMHVYFQKASSTDTSTGS